MCVSIQYVDNITSVHTHANGWIWSIKGLDSISYSYTCRERSKLLEMGHTITSILLLGYCTLTIIEGWCNIHQVCIFSKHLYLSPPPPPLVLVSEAASTLKVSESNGSSVFVEMLRGRDGLAGRDGLPGKTGEQGLAGPPGPPGPLSGGGHLHQMGEEFLPASRGHWVTLLWYCWGKLAWPQGRCSELPVYAHGPRIQLHPHIPRWGAGKIICVWGWVSEPYTNNTRPQCSLCCVLCVH